MKLFAHKIHIRFIDIILSFYMLLGLLNLLWNESGNLNLFVLAKWSSLCLCYITVRMFVNKRLFLWGIVAVGFGESIVVFLQKASLINSSHHVFEITGTFGNPGQLGGLLAVALTVTLGILLLYKHKPAIFMSLVIVFLSIGVALLLSDSRASWLAALAGCLFVHPKPTVFFRKLSLLAKVVVILFFLVVCTIGYLYKKDSADGRLLIWRISAEMIADKPITGHGVGSFENKYMYYQAAYFSENPDSAYVEFADNVMYPYNELLHVWVEMGLLGLLLSLIIISSLFLCILSTDINRIYKGSLIALLVYSMFSYPSYVFSLMLLYAVLLGGVTTKRVIKTERFSTRFIVYPSIILLGFIVAWRVAWHYRINAELNKLYSGSQSERLLAASFLEEHYKMIQYTPRTLNLYAKYSFKYYSPNKSIAVLEDAAQKIPTSELFCDMGDLYKREGENQQAIKCFQLATYMIPNRLLPKYKLFTLYQETEAYDKARKIGEDILNTSVKVESTITLKIRGDVKRYLESYRVQ